MTRKRGRVGMGIFPEPYATLVAAGYVGAEVPFVAMTPEGDVLTADGDRERFYVEGRLGG